jgi:hypothetical protein
MKKALHECFYVLKTDKTGKTDGKPPIRYDKKFTSYLIEGANNHINKLEGRDSVQMTHDEFICWCMNEYFKKGASPALLNTLNSHVCIVGHQCHVMHSGKKLVAMFVAHIPHKPPPTVFAAYMFSNMTSLGWLDGLKKCQSDDCQQFFIGRPNVKWCSKTCGSRSRVKKMRKRNKSK